MARFLLLWNSIAPNDGRYEAKLPIKPLRMCAEAWPAAFLFWVTARGRLMRTAERRFSIGGAGPRHVVGDACPHALLRGLLLASMLAVRAEPLVPEKDELKFGFIKLTDMAPLAIAKELGYFEDEGLYVTLEPQANWKVLLDRVITGELDGAHMLAGQPLAATIGFGTKAHIVTPFSMDLNGNAITVSNDVWAMMKPHVPVADGKPVHPIKADALKPVIEKFRAEGKPFNMGMVFPVSTHNYELRYWLAAGRHSSRPLFARATCPARSRPTCCSR